MQRDEGRVAERLDVVHDGRAARGSPSPPGTADARRPCRAGPASELRSAVSSPTTYEPAPSSTWTWKEKPLPWMSSPRSPAAYARRDRRLERRLRERVLGADVDEAVAGADRVAGERHALEQELGVPLHQVLVDVGAGVALVAVDDDELLLGRGSRRANSHFEPGGEAGAAAAAQVRRLHLLAAAAPGVSSASARRRPDQSPGRVSTGSSRTLRHSGSRGRLGRARQHALERARARVDRRRRRGRTGSSGRSRGRRSRRARPRRRRSARPSRTPRPASSSRDVLVEVGRPAGRAGADADVPLAARLAQVVVVGGDAVDGGLRQARDLRGDAAGRRR